MTERLTLLDAISTTTNDYRVDELKSPTPDHVEKWIRQFPEYAQLTILSEMNYVLKKTYYSLARIQAYIDATLRLKKICGEDPKSFWKSANFLDIQNNGSSQKEILKLVNKQLLSNFGFDITDCGSKNGVYIYFDDLLFTGNRMVDDLSKWIIDAEINNAKVISIFLNVYSYGLQNADNRLKRLQRKENREIEIGYFYRDMSRNDNKANNEWPVLWPIDLPDNEIVKDYVLENHIRYFRRKPSTAIDPFSSVEKRKVLENEFLLAGLKIRSFCKKPSRNLRPLGYGDSAFGFGFGSLHVTHRNCPNNSPLALWWGDPSVSKSSPLSKWFPLFPRKTYINDWEEL